MIRRPLAILALLLPTVLATCVLDHSNAFDPFAPLRSPNAIPFKYSENIKSIEPTAIELTWQRSTEADFLCYVVSRSDSPIGLSNRVLTSDESNKIADEFQKNPATNFWNYSASDLASKMPTFASIFKPVSLLPNANANSYRHEGLSNNTKYYFAISVVLKNGRTFSTSAEFAIETTPDLVSARNCDLLTYFKDQPSAINDVDIDPQTGEIYISGYCWGSSKAMTNAASYSYDYFLAMVDTNSAFNSLGYIWEAHMMLLSQHTNAWSDFRKIVGFAVHTNYKVIVPEMIYPDWTIWRVSNLASALAAPPDNRLKYTSGTGLGSYTGIIDDYSSYIVLDKANNKMYIAGDDIDVMSVGATTFGYLTTFTYSGVRLRLNGISLNSAGTYLFVSDVEKNIIYKVNTTSGGFAYFCGAPGNRFGEFLNVSDTEVDSSGNVYVADTGNHRVQKFDASGVFLSSYNLRDKVGTQFESPRGLKIYKNKLYVGCAKGIIELPIN